MNVSPYTYEQEHCQYCKYYVDGEGITDNDRYLDGMCHKIYPRGYVGGKKPHKVSKRGKCFQWEYRGDLI